MRQTGLGISFFLIFLFYGAGQAEGYELVIQFAQGTSPKELQQQIIQRKEYEDDLVGKIKLKLEDAALRMFKKSTPEEKLQRIRQIDEQTGVVRIRQVFSDNTYLIWLDGHWSEEQARILYNSLPEVIFAEANSYETVSL